MSEENPVAGMGKKEFCEVVKKFNPHADCVKIAKAYDFAKEAHKNQKRLSGVTYFDRNRNV